MVMEKAQSQGNLIVAAYQNNMPVLYSYCNSYFFIHDFHGKFGLINVQHIACNFD